MYASEFERKFMDTIESTNKKKIYNRCAGSIMKKDSTFIYAYYTEISLPIYQAGNVIGLGLWAPYS